MPLLSPPFVGGTSQASYTDGQLLIGDSTTNQLDKGTLTADGGITVTNGHGTISIGSTPGQLPGTTTNDNATAGNVGEYLSTIVTIGSEVSINVAANIATLSLTAGDWDVSGEMWVDTQTGGATINNKTSAAITLTSATLPTAPSDATAKVDYNSALLAGGSGALNLTLGPVRVSLAGTTNVFLVGATTVSAGTCFAYGKLMARRMR